jgi:putative ABC transport system substrate-binding protein
MKRRNLFLYSAWGLFPWLAFAQPSLKVWRIGYLDFGSRQASVDSGRIAALVQGLADQGYIDGKNMLFEGRFADGDLARLNVLAAEMVQQKVDVIMTVGSETSLSAHRATATIPIVVTNTTDPVHDGYAVSLARPGYNLTGMTNGQADTVQKLVELLALAVPKMKRVAVLTNPTSYSGKSMLQQIQLAAHQTGKQVLPLSAGTPQEIDHSFELMAREHVDAIVIPTNAFLIARRTQIAELALKHRLPLITQSQFNTEAGGLMSYGANANDIARRAGIFVDKILKGTKPGDIPFEQPTRYYLIINRKTANALGVRLNNELLARADKVIE